MSYKYLLAFISLWSSVLHAEIQEVTVKWTAAMCWNCEPLFYRYFSQIQGVESIQLEAGIGQINLKWKPGVTFEFTPIKNALQLVGVGLDDFRLRVRGKITHDEQNVYLISDGDDTSFLLINPIKPEPGYTVPASHFTRDLNPRLREELLAGEKRGEMAIIRGPIFEPYRSPPEPLKLQVENVKFEKKEEQVKSSD